MVEWLRANGYDSMASEIIVKKTLIEVRLLEGSAGSMVQVTLNRGAPHLPCEWRNLPGSFAAEISTGRGQRIALALVQKHAEPLTLSTPGFLKSFRLAVEAELPRRRLPRQIRGWKVE